MVSLFDALGLGAFRAFASQDLCLHNLVTNMIQDGQSASQLC